MRDVYAENSYGALVLNSTVYGWVTLPHTEQYYAGGSSGLSATVHQAITDALTLADGLINFSHFDDDANGFVDSIAFIHSGYGAEWGGTDADGTGHLDRIWSHRWQITGWTSAEGVRVRDYHINPGLWSTSGAAPGRIGVICHETGHFFGLPDLYDTNGGGQGIGSYCMMANSWGFSGNQWNPPHFSAWSKIFLGWMAPTLLTAAGNYSLAQAETTPAVGKITSGFPTGEYLLIENRQPFGFERTMPQGGLAIWHIDESKFDNSDEGYPGQSGWPGNNRHYRIALLQADGRYDLERGNNRGDLGDLFHAGGVSEISPSTTPSTNAYQNGTAIDSGNRIFAISNAGPTMTFGYSRNSSAGTGFFVANDGSADLDVTGIMSAAGAPWISWNPAAPFTVAPGATQFVTVSVNFAQAPQGTTSTRLLVTSNDPDESPYPGGVNVTVVVVSPPVITSAAAASGTVGQAFSYQIVASNSPTSYNAFGLPAGLSVNTSSGLISGTPTVAGTSTVSLSATNSSGTGTKVLNVTVLTPQETWRQRYFGTTANSGDAADTADPDADGNDNLFEYVAGLVPTDRLSRFAVSIEPLPLHPERMAIIFRPLVPGRTYVVKRKASLRDPAWTPLATFSTTDNGTERTVVDMMAGGGAKFYHVEITPP